jgi:glyoxalase family protein
MKHHVQGLHHITSIASDVQVNNTFFTHTLGLRRVKKTVNFDQPDTYHLYYGDKTGTPGTVMTYFPFRNAALGRPGTGEVSETVFSVANGALAFWKGRLEQLGVQGLVEETRFGEHRLTFEAPDGDVFALAEVEGDARPGWTGDDIQQDDAVRGFHSATLRLHEGTETGELLAFMGYEATETEGSSTRYRTKKGNGANFIDIDVQPGLPRAIQGAGSVHHIAFAVPDRAVQLQVRQSLLDTGYQVTPVIDRDYFWAIYFRSPGGVLFEVATDEPGFDRDEPVDHLGEALKLPEQHERLRAQLETYLDPIND